MYVIGSCTRWKVEIVHNWINLCAFVLCPIIPPVFTFIVEIKLIFIWNQRKKKKDRHKRIKRKQKSLGNEQIEMKWFWRNFLRKHIKSNIITAGLIYSLKILLLNRLLWVFISFYSFLIRFIAQQWWSHLNALNLAHLMLILCNETNVTARCLHKMWTNKKYNGTVPTPSCLCCFLSLSLSILFRMQMQAI